MRPCACFRCWRPHRPPCQQRALGGNHLRLGSHWTRRTWRDRLPSGAALATDHGCASCCHPCCGVHVANDNGMAVLTGSCCWVGAASWVSELRWRHHTCPHDAHTLLLRRATATRPNSASCCMGTPPLEHGRGQRRHGGGAAPQQPQLAGRQRGAATQAQGKRLSTAACQLAVACWGRRPADPP
jgi:hypothetical protein